MKRVLHALAALWLGRPKTGDRRRKTEDRWKTEEMSRKAEDRWKTEERRREHEGAWLPEARNGLLQHLTAMMRMGETVRELATRECTHLPIRESANEQLSESAHLQTNESALERTDNQLPKRVIVSEREHIAERIGEPLPIAQVLARVYLRSATQCIIGKATQASESANKPISESAIKSESASKLLTTVVAVLLAVFMCLLSAQQVSAQAEPAAAAVIQPLQIGDAIPEELWHMPLQVVNHPEGKETITLNDYRGKLIILDFWATWCAACIQSLYKLDTLQSQFMADIAVIPATDENAHKAAMFFDERGWTLPTAVRETALRKYFPYQSIPHQVWIKAGKVVAITGPAATTYENISQAIAGGVPRMQMRINPVSLDRKQPLFANGNGGNGKALRYQSIISLRVDAPIAGTVIQSGQNEILAYNQTLAKLYYTAFGSEIDYDINRRVFWELSDSLLIELSGRNRLGEKAKRLSGNFASDSAVWAWASENTYCYNLVFPDGLPRETALKFMQDDLNRFFTRYRGVAGFIEKKPFRCLVLAASDGTNRLATSGGKPAVDDSGDRYLRRNRPFASLVDLIRQIDPQGLHMVDDTGFAGSRIDLDLPKDFNKDLETVSKHLGALGLRLSVEQRMLPVLVMRAVEF